jgi:hypothetical protein
MENKTQNSELMFKALQWLATDDTGRSSETICFYLLGVDYLYPSHPYDRGDFGRCYRLLEFIPEFRLRLDELRELSPEWYRLIDNWEVLETEYKKDDSHLNFYLLIDSILDGDK